MASCASRNRPAPALSAYNLRMRGVLLLSLSCLVSAQTYDVVIASGRVMDPESRLDAVRHVGIRGAKIAAISETPLAGRTVIEASGKVVAPGFIDLHAHGQTNEANEYQAHDGVTTALELEVGVPAVGAFLKDREGKAILNYGATCSHGAMRTLAMKKFAARTEGRRDTAERWRELNQLGRYESIADPEEYTQLGALMERGLREGALGIGMAHQYYPGASREEIFRVFQMAERWSVPIFTHVREMGPDAMQEVIANAAATGVALHIVHVNSMSGGELPLVLDIIESARKRGIDITTEAYPYTAASTFIESTIFDGDWQKRLGISYGDLQWQNTAERLTAESFARYRQQGGVVIMHFMKPEWIRRAMAAPFVMVASDGMPYAPGAHPRSAGTFARVLGLYVREEGVLSLMDALAKMTILPARRLEAIAPAMRGKGRLRVGADADITVFDAATVRDRATFEKGLAFSEGIEQVLVNGVAVVRDGRTVKDAFPGRAVTGNYRR
jgi:N-acyl-D-aspartate/D-glutamate deacylase